MSGRDAGRGGRFQSVVPYMWLGSGAVVVLLGGLIGWAVTAQISGAVIATGVVAVEGKVKDVQHLEGGIVGRIAVRDGDRVRAGDLLVRLDDTLLKANLAIAENQLIELLGRLSRLEAERDGSATIRFDDRLGGLSDAAARAAMEAEQRTLLAARNETRAGQIAQLEQSNAQLNDEIRGLDAQRQANEDQISLINQELKGLESLFAQGHAPITRVLALKRELANLKGDYGRKIADMARARAAIGENKLKILQIGKDAREEALTEIRDARVRIAELAERRNAVLEQLRRIDIRAPRDGIVHDMTVHTVGGVIQAAETILKIVPENDRLIVEARVEPQGIDQVRPGQDAAVRFSAFNQRTTPEVTGTVIKVSADSLNDPATGVAFYVAKVAIGDAERRRLGDQALLPGMPADIFIQTGDRSALSYLLKPFTDQVALAFREE